MLCPPTQVRTILVPSRGQQRWEALTPAEMSLVYEVLARSLSMQTQEVSLHLWNLSSAAAPKRLLADIKFIQRDNKALGEQIKGVLALNAAEVLNTTYQAKYLTGLGERYARYCSIYRVHLNFLLVLHVDIVRLVTFVCISARLQNVGAILE